MSEYGNSFEWIRNHLDIKLQWMKRMAEFDRDHLAILMKCSYKNRPWVTYSELAKIGINENNLKDEIAYLLSIKVLLLRVDTKSNYYFALRERFEG